MTQDEALTAIQHGEKVTHKYFTPNEYITKGTQGGIMFEDGIQTTWFEFFRLRKEDYWKDGWSIWQPQK